MNTTLEPSQFTKSIGSRVGKPRVRGPPIAEAAPVKRRRVANQLANGEKLAEKKKANSKRGVLNKNMWDLERTEAERSGSELWDAPAAAPTEVDLNPWLHPLRGHAGRNMDENGAAVPIKAPHSFGDSMPTSIAAVVPVASGASYNPSDAAHQVGGCGDLALVLVAVAVAIWRQLTPSATQQHDAIPCVPSLPL
jgi:hypothetical protein